MTNQKNRFNRNLKPIILRINTIYYSIMFQLMWIICQKNPRKLSQISDTECCPNRIHVTRIANIHLSKQSYSNERAIRDIIKPQHSPLQNLVI